jgi:hypothetical protein
MKQSPDGRNYYRLIEEKLFEFGGIKDLDLAELLFGGRILARVE